MKSTFFWFLPVFLVIQSCASLLPERSRRFESDYNLSNFSRIQINLLDELKKSKEVQELEYIGSEVIDPFEKRLLGIH